MHCMFVPLYLLYICLLLCVFVCVPVLHVMVWVCVVVGSIRRGPSLIESLRGWMSSWFTQSCSTLFCTKLQWLIRWWHWYSWAWLHHYDKYYIHEFCGVFLTDKTSVKNNILLCCKNLIYILTIFSGCNCAPNSVLGSWIDIVMHHIYRYILLP